MPTKRHTVSLRGNEGPSEPFIADRTPTRIEMVLIEKSALIWLTSVSKAMLTMKKKMDQPDSNETLAIEAAVRLAEGALNVSDRG